MVMLTVAAVTAVTVVLVVLAITVVRYHCCYIQSVAAAATADSAITFVVEPSLSLS